MDYNTIMTAAGDSFKDVFQISLFIALGVCNMFTSIENTAVNFLSPVHSHWCYVPGYDPEEVRYKAGWGYGKDYFIVLRV